MVGNETDLREPPIVSEEILTIFYSNYHVIPYGISMLYAVYIGMRKISLNYSMQRNRLERVPHIVCEEINLRGLLIAHRLYSML